MTQIQDHLSKTPYSETQSVILATLENKAHLVQIQVIEAREKQPGERGRRRKQRQKEERLWCLHFGDQEMQTHIKK